MGAITDPQGALSAIENVVLFDLIEGTLYSIFQLNFPLGVCSKKKKSPG